MSATLFKRPVLWSFLIMTSFILLPILPTTGLFADPGEQPYDGEQSGPHSDSDEHENRGEGKHEEGDDDHNPSVVSINSTSLNNPYGPPESRVVEQPFVDLDEFTVIAVNDLGIHCGDMDTRMVNILPPFNVMHAVVIRKGKDGPPVALDDSQINVVYSAVSNPNDPALALEPVLTPEGGVFKTNFWKAVEDGAYDPLYPPPLTPLQHRAVRRIAATQRSFAYGGSGDLAGQ